MKKLNQIVLFCVMIFARNILGSVDFERYTHEDSDLLLKRREEDKARREQWQREDVALKEARAKEDMFTRLIHKVTSDTRADQETEAKRNATKLEINRQRMLEDFDIRKQRFDEFRTQHADFSEKNPFKILLRLGDVSSFIDMSSKQRFDFLKQIEASVSILDNPGYPGFFENPETAKALRDLIRLSMPKEFAVRPDVQRVLNVDLAGQTADELGETQKSLMAQLKLSIQDSLETMKKFDTDMEAMKGDVRSIKALRILKMVGHATAVILAFSAVVVMVGVVPPLGIALGVTALFIGAKLGYLVGHISEAEEVSATVKLQNKFNDIFRPLLPQTVELLDASTATRNLAERARAVGHRVSELGTSVRVMAGKARDWLSSTNTKPTPDKIELDANAFETLPLERAVTTVKHAPSGKRSQYSL